VNKTVRWFLMLPKEQTGSFQEEEILAIKWAHLEDAKKLLKYDSDMKLLKRLALLV
jgi:hypothetical protein